MTFENAVKLVDLLTEMAVAEVERKALDSDHWEHADHLATAISTKRMEAIALLEDEP
jgi:hypothetical protein